MDSLLCHDELQLAMIKNPKDVNISEIGKYLTQVHIET